MREKKEARSMARMQRQLLFIISKGTVCMLLIVVACTVLAQPAFAMPKKHARVNSILNAEVYDVSRGRYLNYYGSQLFVMGSSFKVPIMLTFFNMIERQGRGYTGQEWNLLTTMIENSNNDSASAVLAEVGGVSAVTSYLQSIGVYGIYPDGNAWGYSEASPYSMVRLLTRLYFGGIVSSYHRSLALSLMENVEADQRWGVGNTAPYGSTVAMKDGWLTGTDGLWAVNSSGIVISGGDTYIISAYTSEDPSFGTGISLVQNICSTVAQQLG